MSESSALPTASAAQSPWSNPRVMVPVALVALYVVWGSTYLAIRVGLHSYPPFAMAALRFAIAGALLYGLLRLRGAAAPTALQWRNAAITGTLLLGFGNGLVCFGEQSVSSGIAAVAVASVPLFAALFGGLYREWPHRRETIGLVIGFLGVVVLNFGSGLKGSPLGAIALEVAAVSWAFGSVWSRRQDMPAGPMNVAAQMLSGSVALALMAALAGERLPAHPTLDATLALAYLVFAGSFIGFSAYLYLLRTVRPALATSYAYVNPPVAVLFGVLLAGEHVGPLDLAGMAVILAGVAIITLAKAKR
ncbi:MAG TPA: drug/metabolite exporter YedA [Mizugakiibacter sp.]